MKRKKRLIMLLNLITILTVLFLFQHNVKAEDINNSDLILTGHTQLNGNEVVLTSDAVWQDGRATTKDRICAKEYKFSFDAYTGDLPASSNGGAGLVFYEIYSDTNAWANVFEFNIQDRARPDRYNYIELLGVNSEITGTLAPYQLNGLGWSHVEFYANETFGVAVVSTSRGVLSVTNHRPYRPGIPIYHQFLGWTGVAHNVHKVRNLKYQVIRPDNCSGEPSLTEMQAESQLSVACGNGDSCEDIDAWVSCRMEMIDTLKDEGRIGEDCYSSLARKCDHKIILCGSQNECSDSLASARKEGYDTGYPVGYDNGVKSIDIQGIKNASYIEGFGAGKASVVCEQPKPQPPTPPAPQPTPNPKAKVKICHKASAKKSRTLTIAQSAVSAHLAHGDTLGECPCKSKKKK